MRLVGEQHAPPGVALTHRLKGGIDLGRVVAVVINDRDFTDGGHHVTDMLQAAVDALEGRQRAADGRIPDA